MEELVLFRGDKRTLPRLAKNAHLLSEGRQSLGIMGDSLKPFNMIECCDGQRGYKEGVSSIGHVYVIAERRQSL